MRGLMVCNTAPIPDTCVRVSCFGFRVSCFVFRVVVFQVSGFEFWVSGLGFKVSNERPRVSGVGSKVWDYHLVRPRATVAVPREKGSKAHFN